MSKAYPVQIHHFFWPVTTETLVSTLEAFGKALVVLRSHSNSTVSCAGIDA